MKNIRASKQQEQKPLQKLADFIIEKRGAAKGGAS